jgi:hypothetical protein
MMNRFRKWLASKPPGWEAGLASVAVHACLLIALAATTRVVLRGGLGSQQSQDGPLQVELENSAGEDAAGDASLLSESSANAAPLDLVEEAPLVAGDELATLAVDDESSATGGLPALASSAGLGPLSTLSLTTSAPRDSGSGGGDGGGGAAPAQDRTQVMRALRQLERPAKLSFFGAVAEGSRFIFVLDHSTSMMGAPLEAAKAQLVGSLQALDAVHQFQVLFFNDQMHAWDLTGGQQRVPFATDANKSQARDFVADVIAGGGTERRMPLLRALAMSPDVIFFLTDADDAMPAYDVAEAVERAQRSRTSIACIEFGIGPSARGENFLTRLAAATGGQYVYVDTTGL